jgi:glycerol-3-phosphate dehydrogenase
MPVSGMRNPSPFHLPFSAASRADHLRTLGERTFDLLVIGGGITGVGVAHDAAGRGLDVALVEAGDLGGGTSSRSSRLIHGGLRYLETFDFGLVFEALGERARLLELAPHLVHPLPFLYPVYRGGPVSMPKLWAGMWAYDSLSLFRGLPTHRMLDRAAVLRREPEIAAEGLKGGALYHDAQVDDARLTLAVGRAAHEAGAVIVTHAPVRSFLRDGGGKITGVAVEDTRTGARVEARARLVLSATGPWTDELRRLADPAAPPRLRPTKGVHIQLRRERVGNRGAVIFRSAVDGRVMFVLPWGPFTYVGTTDTDFTAAPERAEPEPADVDYLLRSLNALLPRVHVTAGDVVSGWAGVRPLLAPDAAGVSAGGTSREHAVWRESDGLLCVAGGKLTTFRAMAADVARRATEVLEREHGVRSGVYYTQHVPLPGAPEMGFPEFLRAVTSRAAPLGLDSVAATHLARSYGTGAIGILREIEGDPSLAAPLVAGLPYRWAEVPYAVRCEMALTLEDVLRRRMHLFYDAEDGGMDVARAVAERMAGEEGIGWGGEEIGAEVARYAEAVERTRIAAPPSR